MTKRLASLAVVGGVNDFEEHFPLLSLCGVVAPCRGVFGVCPKPVSVGFCSVDGAYCHVVSLFVVGMIQVDAAEQ